MAEEKITIHPLSAMKTYQKRKFRLKNRKGYDFGMRRARLILGISLSVLFLNSITSIAGGFEDLTVTNIRSASDFHRTDSSTITAEVISDNGSMTLGNTSRQLDFNHQVAIEIVLRAVGSAPAPDEYSVEWFFVAKDVNTNERWVFDNGTKPVPTGNLTLDVASHVVGEHREKDSSTSLDNGAVAMINSGAASLSDIPVNTSNSAFKEGNKIEGWVVMLKHRDNIEKVAASLSELEDLAEDNPNLFEKIAASHPSSN